jgi:Asp-tRNA(Asn)/Glu-tRNA(Gln) amidotransferase A subunit family amidase
LDTTPSTVRRRDFLKVCAASGVASGLFPGVLWARMEAGDEITASMIAEAEQLAGLSFAPEQRELMLRALTTQRARYDGLRTVPLAYDVPPALSFAPVPVDLQADTPPARVTASDPAWLPDPSDETGLAFASIAQLGRLLRDGRVTSRQLTELALRRLERFDAQLACVVTLLPDRALARADAADGALAEGRDLGPLHGIPWGAKDLFAVAGAPTTWGATPFQEQQLDGDATVVRRLDEAGAVLVAKLTLGALAQGDVWFGGQTKNPWNLAQGSSGSSAGSAAAVAAGLVPFALGSETLGSIVSPAARCGVTGVRPSFGWVSRAGAMPLSWSMDKVGPLVRSVEDGALVLAALVGPDALDPTVRPAPLVWDVSGDRIDDLRVGILAGAFEAPGEDREFHEEALRVLRGLGVTPIPVELPDHLPLASLRVILPAEAAASFDELTRSGRDALLVSQGPDAWPNTFRSARFIPAVEYIQANRIRTLLVQAMEALFTQVDVVVAPSFAPDLLLASNLSGHPCVAIPSGVRADGTATSLSFLAGLDRDVHALRLAHAWQVQTTHHQRRPPGFGGV